MDSQGIDMSKKSDQRKIGGEDNGKEPSSSNESDGDGKSTIVTRSMIVNTTPPSRLRTTVFSQRLARFGISSARPLVIPAPKIPTADPMTLRAPTKPTSDPMTFASPIDIQTDCLTNIPAPQKPRHTSDSARTLKINEAKMPLESLMTFPLNITPSKTNVAARKNLKQRKTTLIGPVKSLSRSGSISSSDSPVDVASMHIPEGIRGYKRKAEEAEPVHFGPSTSSHRFDEELNEQEAAMLEPHNIELFLKRMQRKVKIVDDLIKDIELGLAKNVNSRRSTGAKPGPLAGQTPGPSGRPTSGPSNIGSHFAYLPSHLKEKLLSEMIHEYDEYLMKAKRFAKYYRRRGDIMTAAILDALK